MKRKIELDDWKLITKGEPMQVKTIILQLEDRWNDAIHASSIVFDKDPTTTIETEGLDQDDPNCTVCSENVMVGWAVWAV
jgi:hypothetical protein